jgi:hypothetical protein
MTTQHFPWVIPIFVGIFFFWVLLWLLARRLRRTFPTVWADLGRPSGKPELSASFALGWEAWKSNFSTFLFVWSGQHSDLNDSQLTGLIWCARAVWILVVTMAVLSLWPA